MAIPWGDTASIEKLKQLSSHVEKLHKENTKGENNSITNAKLRSLLLDIPDLGISEFSKYQEKVNSNKCKLLKNDVKVLGLFTTSIHSVGHCKEWTKVVKCLGLGSSKYRAIFNVEFFNSILNKWTETHPGQNKIDFYHRFFLCWTMYDGIIKYHPPEHNSSSYVEVEIGHSTENEDINHRDNALWKFFKNEYFDELGITYSYYHLKNKKGKFKGIIAVRYFGEFAESICKLWNQIENNDNGKKYHIERKLEHMRMILKD